LGGVVDVQCLGGGKETRNGVVHSTGGGLFKVRRNNGWGLDYETLINKLLNNKKPGCTSLKKWGGGGYVRHLPHLP